MKTMKKRFTDSFRSKKDGYIEQAKKEFLDQVKPLFTVVCRNDEWEKKIDFDNLETSSVVNLFGDYCQKASFRAQPLDEYNNLDRKAPNSTQLNNLYQANVAEIERACNTYILLSNPTLSDPDFNEQRQQQRK